MKIQKSFLLAFLAASATAAPEFTKIEGDFGKMTAFEINPCMAITTDLDTIPNTMWTVETTDEEVTVSSYPANLVSVENNNGVISFQWNRSVAKKAASGGVRFGFPAGQVTKASFGNGVVAHMHLTGNEAVSEIKVSEGANVKAAFTNNNVASIALSVTGFSEVNMQSNVDVTGTVSSGSTLSIKAPKFDNFSVLAGFVNLDGSLGSGSIGAGSRAKVTKAAEGSINVKSGSNLDILSCENVVTELGSFRNKGQSVCIG